MAHRSASFIVLLVCLLIAGCGYGDPGPQSDRLALPAGEFAFSVTTFDEETEETTLWTAYRVRLNVVEEASAPGISSQRFRLDGERIDTGEATSTWYELRGDGLFEVAYAAGGSPGGVAHPRPAGGVRFAPAFEAALAEASFLPLPAGDVEGPIVREPPRKLYPNPLRVGAAWEEIDLGFLRRISRVDRVEAIDIPEGRFEAFVVISEFPGTVDPPGYLRVVAHVVPGMGMVRREVQGRTEATNEFGAPIGWARTLDRVERVAP